MKKSTRIISVILAMVMCVTSLSIAASAQIYDYSTPAGYDNLEKPYLSFEQAGSLLLDFVDNMLADANINENIDLSILGNIKFDLRSIDRMINSLIDLKNMTLFSVAVGMGLVGDIGNIDFGDITSLRRTTPGTPDYQVLYMLTRFLRTNRTIIGKLIDDTLSLGMIGWFVDINDLLGGNVITLVRGLLYDLLVDPATSTLTPNSNVDTMVDEFVYDLVVGPNGMLPSLEAVLVRDGLMSKPGKANFKLANISFYALFRSLIPAALDELVGPMLVGLFEDLDPMILEVILGVLGIDPEEIPDTTEEFVSRLLDLQNGYLRNFILLNEEGFFLLPAFYDMLTMLLGVLNGLLPTLSLYPNIELRTEQEVEAITDEAESVAYLLRTVLVGMMDFAVIPASVTSLREVVCYLLINMMGDWYPDRDYYAMIANGTLNPKGDGVMEIAAAFIQYYINALLPVNIPEGLSFEDTLAWVIDNYLLAQFGGFLNTTNVSPSDNVWKKLDIILWKNLFNRNWLHPDFSEQNYPDGTLTKSLIFDKLIYAILDWNFEELFSLLRSHPTGEFNKSLADLIITILRRILNGVFGGNQVIPNSITNLNQIVQASMLRTIVQNLFYYLPNYIDPLLRSAMPLLTSMMVGNEEREGWRPQPPPGTYYDAAQLRVILERQIPDRENSSIPYTDPNYFFIGPEDFILYQYYNYTDMRDEALALLARIDAGDPDVTAQNIIATTYRLEYYYNRMQPRIADTKQLLAEINGAKAFYGSGDYEFAFGSKGPATQFTLKTWYDYLAALEFATQVYEEKLFDNLNGTTFLRQSKITFARRLLIEAQKLLKKFGAEADLSVLLRYLASAEQIFLEDELAIGGAYFPESLLVLRDAYWYGVEVANAGWDGSDQNIIDEAAIAVKDAIDSLAPIPDLVPVTGSRTVLDRGSGYAWGFQEGFKGFYDYVEVRKGANGFMQIEPNLKGGYGTGAKINLVLELGGPVVRSYTVLVFGDVDGNTWADGMDANVLNAAFENLLDLSYNLGPAFEVAGDANGDGVVDRFDYNLLLQSGLKTAKVDQKGVLN